MIKLDRKKIMAITFLLILFAPIKEGYRYLILSAFPFYLAISNFILIKNLLVFQEENLKYKRMEEKYGTKKAFLLYVLLLIVIPITIGGMFIISGIRIL